MSRGASTDTGELGLLQVEFSGKQCLREILVGREFSGKAREQERILGEGGLPCSDRQTPAELTGTVSINGLS